MLLKPPTASLTRTADEVLDKMLSGVQRQHDEWTETDVEQGEINGIAFVRKRWSGNHRVFQRRMHGFGYVAKLSDQFVYINSQDFEPDHAAPLALAEAAAHTFRRP